MGMFDKVRVEEGNCFGILPGHYQTKDLDDIMAEFVIGKDGVFRMEHADDDNYIGRFADCGIEVLENRLNHGDLEIHAFYSDIEAGKPADWVNYHPGDPRADNRGEVTYRLRVVNNQVTEVITAKIWAGK